MLIILWVLNFLIGNLNHVPNNKADFYYDSRNMNITSHDSIVIDSNADFLYQGWQGEGSLSNPYRIENLNFISLYTAIDISRTTVFFVIRNCTFVNGYCDIIISNVMNGRIKNCSFIDSREGIEIGLSTECSIINCTFRTEEHNIALDILNSEECLVQENKFSNSWCGLSLLDSEDCMVIQNQFQNVSRGIMINRDSESIIKNNTIYQVHNIGIEVESSFGCHISTNNISYTNADSIWDRGDGLRFEDSINCNVTQNFIHHFQIGIRFEGSKNFECHYNVVIQNQAYGLKIETGSSGNAFTSNSLGWNILNNAEDNGGNNYWEGNLWSDYFENGDYIIPGSESAIDEEPLVLSQDYNVSPVIGSNSFESYEAAVIPGTTSYNLEWFADDLDPLDFRILMNGTLVSTGSWQGNKISLIVNHETPGIYNYTLILTDTQRNGECSITILRVRSPTQSRIAFTLIGFSLLPILLVFAYILKWWKTKIVQPIPPRLEVIGFSLGILTLLGPQVFTLSSDVITIFAPFWTMHCSLSNDRLYFGLFSGAMFLLVIPQFVYLVQILRYYENKTSKRLTFVIGLLAEFPNISSSIFGLFGPYPFLVIPIPLVLFSGLIIMWLYPRESST